MNDWQAEFLAEYNRQRILQEVEQIRLEALALKSHAYRLSLFARVMVTLANWMIAAGKQVHEQYEAPEKVRL